MYNYEPTSSIRAHIRRGKTDSTLVTTNITVQALIGRENVYQNYLLFWRTERSYFSQLFQHEIQLSSRSFGIRCFEQQYRNAQFFRIQQICLLQWFLYIELSQKCWGTFARRRICLLESFKTIFAIRWNSSNVGSEGDDSERFLVRNVQLSFQTQ